MRMVPRDSVRVEARSTSNDCPKSRVHKAPHSTMALRLTAVKLVNWKCPVRAKFQVAMAKSQSSTIGKLPRG